jgi:hypothetical protein
MMEKKTVYACYKAKKQKESRGVSFFRKRTPSGNKRSSPEM